MRRILFLLLLIVAAAACAQPQPEAQHYPHPDLLFTTSATCALCHDGIVKDGKDVSMYSNWRKSMMSSAAIDPYFLAKMSSEIADFPELKNAIEEKCLTCHMPMAATQLRAEDKAVSLENVKRYSDLALDGVSCTLCHQIRSDNFGEDSSFSGGYSIDAMTKKPDRLAYGPFIPLWANVMRGNSGYVPTKGEHVESAELCAVCHTLYTPTVKDGRIVGSFPEQTPFLEWRNSIYAGNITCQDCHMPHAKAKASTRPAKLEERDIAVHEFVGGNVQMLSLLGGAAEKAKEQLKRAAGVKIVSITTADNVVRVVVRVENHAGHKFPTGFPSRRAFLHLVAYSGDRMVFESGKYDENGRIEGEDAPYELHHDVIDDPNEVQIYEAVMVDVGRSVTHKLLAAASYVKDNRILPRGFDPDKAHPDTIAIGTDSDVNFVAGSDTVTYVLPGNATKVRVELLYQPISYGALKSLTATTETESFLKRFEGVAKTTLVDFDEATILGQ